MGKSLKNIQGQSMMRKRRSSEKIRGVMGKERAETKNFVEVGSQKSEY